MDPNATLQELIELAEQVNATPSDGDIDWADATRLAELVTALDGWLSTGGFLPQRWERQR